MSSSTTTAAASNAARFFSQNRRTDSSKSGAPAAALVARWLSSPAGAEGVSLDLDMGAKTSTETDGSSPVKAGFRPPDRRRYAPLNSVGTMPLKNHKETRRHTNPSGPRSLAWSAEL